MIATPQQLQFEKRPPRSLTFWTIYKHPKDAPDAYVLRAQWAVAGKVIISTEAWYAHTPEELRALLPLRSLTRMDFLGDDPAIFEVWME